MRPLCLAMLLGLPAMSVAQPQIFTATRIQTLPTPQPLANSFGGAVIDGDSIIVPTLTDAYLYRRAANGIWNFSGSLVHVTSNPSYRMQAAMKNSIAVIRIGGNTSVWEKVGGQWRQSQTAAPITAPGRFVISSNRFMVGGDGCAADALIYQKNSAGIWDVMGRVPPDSNQCPVDGLSVDFSYDTVVVNDHYSPTRTYHRNGSGMDWARTGDVGTASAGFPALQADTIVLSDLSYYRRNGTAWKLAGQLRPLDYAYGAGDFGSPLYRDGVALVNDGALDFDGNWEPYLYMRNAQGGFDHVGIVRANAYVSSFDISGDTVVTIESEQRDDWYTDVNVYQLPVNRFRARAIANNFDARNVSDFAPSAGSQYSIAGNSYNYLYRQSNGVAETASVIGGSDWSDYQSFEVELKPNAFSRANAWVGIAVRYADADNYYLASFGNDQVVRLQRKLNGVVTTLAQANAPVSPGTWQKTQLIADASGVRVLGLPSGGLFSPDKTLKRGRVAVLTSAARADFDNLLVKSTEGFAVFHEQPPYISGKRDFTHVGGHWTASSDTRRVGFIQDDTSGQALLIYGPTLDDQAVKASVHLDAYASSNPVAWYGVVARYVDPNNFYYLSVRSSGTLQIRKVVHGVITVLKAVNFTPSATPDGKHWLQLTAIGNELTALVDEIVVARAVDDQIARGRTGLGTYRAAATFDTFAASQP